jgi:two-component system sensor histidine kinase EvgS
MKRSAVTRTLFALIFPLAFCAVVHGSQLQLSPAEKAWIKEHGTIRMSGPQAFPPFQYFDEDGAFKGMASDYIFHIADMAGLNVAVVKKIPWPEVLKKIERKDIDILSCAAVTPERAHYLSYTKPLLSFPLIIISRKDAPFISGIESLHGKKVALVRKNSTYEWLQNDKIHVVPRFAESPLEALKDVSEGRSDASIENLAAATYLIEKNGLTNLKIAAPTSYGNYDLSIAVRKDWPELVSIFNKGLSAISQEKHNEIRQRWISVRYEYGLSTNDIIKWVLLVAGISSILLSSFYFWNRKLAREILERKKAEDEKEKVIAELRDAIDEIKTLRGILPICCECKKIRDDKGYWNQIELYISHHTEAEFSHGICPDCAQKLYHDLPDRDCPEEARG